jgi:cardiolipin synthase
MRRATGCAWTVEATVSDLAPFADNRRATTQPRCAKIPAGSLALLALLNLAGCATVPHVDATSAPSSTTSPSVSGARGALSQREAQVVLARLAAAAPNAGTLERHLAIEQAIAESPLFTGNSVQILQDGRETFPAMFDAIRGARQYIDLEYYIFEDVNCNGTRLSDLLISKRQAGVEINVIYDAVGSIATPSDFLSRLQQAGVTLVQFNPLNPLKAKAHYSINDRDHRKMLIADGAVAILGGVNLSSTYESAPRGLASPPSPDADSGTQAARTEPAEKPQEVWRDIDVEISGPVVTELQDLFLQHWRDQHGPPLGEHPATPPGKSQGSEIVRIVGSSPSRLTSRYYVTVLSAIRAAEHTVWITASYFVPTDQEKDDLMHAARHGIDVRLLLPSHSDSAPALAVQHSHYSGLLKAGVKIYERERDVLHSKTMIVDTVWSITGSSNFDHRSVLFNDEVDAVIIGASTGKQLEKIFQDELQRARRIDLASWRQRPAGAKLREQFWRLWQKLL